MPNKVAVHFYSYYDNEAFFVFWVCFGLCARVYHYLIFGGGICNLPSNSPAKNMVIEKQINKQLIATSKCK